MSRAFTIHAKHIQTEGRHAQYVSCDDYDRAERYLARLTYQASRAKGIDKATARQRARAKANEHRTERVLVLRQLEDRQLSFP